MLFRTAIVSALIAASSPVAAPALAATFLTQQKALAGNVTPGDLPGFPVTLSRAGPYSFAGNLTVPAGRDGIAIATSDVSLDMNGFYLNGSGGAADKGITGSARGATISNGTILNFGGNGIDAGAAEFWIIRDMRIIGNQGSGIHCGTSCHVEGSIIFSNAVQGIASESSAVIGNVIANNGVQGVSSGGAGIGNNALILNTFSNTAGNTLRMDPNMCRSATTLGFC